MKYGKYKNENKHWKYKMKCIQIENEVKTINTMRHQTIYKWKGTAAAGGSPRVPRGPSPAAAAPFHLYWSFSLLFLFVYLSFYASNVYLTYISFYNFEFFFFGSRLPSGGFWKMNIDFTCFQNAKKVKFRKIIDYWKDARGSCAIVPLFIFEKGWTADPFLSTYWK